ncbi:general substrate transporter [Mytilinidion resinicola]|uniref:General substrate transporter n=1 Tax=Mytilinidion resinicola TaxID=574789 RepID=A0A6A6Y999_9PEZI|nr:general substrate transporter [Mytilinidion resinicola]KAF2805123.1 general substrate transporter [Mytilinidion resinicola]
MVNVQHVNPFNDEEKNRSQSLKSVERWDESPAHRKETGNGRIGNVQTWRAVKEYKKALFWASFVGLSGIMWGYDVLIGAGLLSSPKFRQDFGYEYKGAWVLQAKWQIAFNTASSIGGFVGCIAMGYLADRFGRRLALAAACCLSCAAIFAQVFASQNGVLLLGKLINGVSLGSYLTISSSYAAEVCPVELRGISTSGVNLFLGIGELLANGVIKACGTRTDRYAYRLPFACQWVFPVFILCGLHWCPESPVWLVRQNRNDDAVDSLARLGYRDIANTLSLIQEANKHEQEEAAQKPASYSDCFRGTDRRRTEIAMGTFAVSQLTGCVFIIGYSTYFFELAGLSNDNAFSLGLGVGAIGIVGNIFSWFLINSVGRRPTILWGACSLCLMHLVLGILDVVPSNGTGNAWGQSVCIILFNCIYFLSVGPIAWALYAEISSSRLRSRTIGLGIVVQNLFGILLPTVIPYMVNPDEANLKGKVGFVFAFTTAPSVVWAFFCVPETSGRSFDELDAMFAAHIPTRRFKDHKS